jgi:cytochrome c-type biogenesis protein CcmH/NrfG
MSIFETTLAELQGIPAEAGELIAGLAASELAAGRVETARSILEGLVVTNPEDASVWTLLSRVHRKLSQPLAARFCAEVAASLAPENPDARLAHAETLLAFPEERAQARALLVSLGAGEDPAGERARSLLAALPQ